MLRPYLVVEEEKKCSMKINKNNWMRGEENYRGGELAANKHRQLTIFLKCRFLR